MLASDLLNPSRSREIRLHKLHRLVQRPDACFYIIKYACCRTISPVHLYTTIVVACPRCKQVLATPSRNKAQLSQGASYRRNV